MKNFIKENWFRITILFMTSLIIFLIIYLYNDFQISKSERQVLESTLTLQEQCATAAQKFFNEDRWGRAIEDTNSSDIDHTNHYSSKHNKCFILITEKISNKFIGTSQVLYDVLENKKYASQSSGTLNLGAYGTPPYESCSIFGGDCKTADEFEQLILEYMEN